MSFKTKLAYKTKLDATMGVREHPYYHPERWLYNHIMLVTLKAFFLSLNGYREELVWAALFHDICKPDRVDRTVNYSKEHDGVVVEGRYDSNFQHAQQGAGYWTNFYGNFDWGAWSRKGYNIPDETYVYLLIKHHMDKHKNIQVDVPLLSDFYWCDDMIGRISTPNMVMHHEHDFPFFQKLGYMGLVYNIGMSPIQRNAAYLENKDNELEFGVVISKVPVTFSFSEIPAMFKGTWVGELIF